MSESSGTGGWTLAGYIAHNEALRSAEQRLQEERDRRYTEVSIEREKAVTIKDEADKRALGLSRDAQTYKDEKANELREQIASERGNYATKDDVMAAVQKIEAQIGPVIAFVTRAQGAGTGASDQRNLLTWALGILVALLSLYTFSQRSDPPPPQIILTPAPPGTMLPSPSAPTAVPR